MKIRTDYENIFNPEAFEKMSKDDFMKMYKGKIFCDLKDAWKWIQKQISSKSKK